MTMQMKNENDYVELIVEGRIDSNTSGALQEEILTLLEGDKHLVVDFGLVTYISSAGLRVLLMGQKAAVGKGKTMELAHVSEMVMEVLETVGFDKILSFK